VSVRNEDAYAVKLSPRQKLPLFELLGVCIGCGLLIWMYLFATNFVNNYIADWRDADMEKPGNNGLFLGKLSNCSAVDMTNRFKPITNYIIIGAICLVVLLLQIATSLVSCLGKNIIANITGAFCSCCCPKRVRSAGKTCWEWATCGCVGKAGYGRTTMAICLLAVQMCLLSAGVLIIIYFRFNPF
jgi:hypothetical protein